MSLLLCLFVFFKQHQEMSLKQKVINGTVIRTGDFIIKKKKNSHLIGQMTSCYFAKGYAK